MKRGLIFVILSSFFTPVYAQPSLEGEVLLEDNSPAVMAHVQLVDTKQSVVTDEKGHFEFPHISRGNHTLQVSYMGTETYLQKVNILKNTSLDIKLKNLSSELEAVTVQAKSEITEQREEPYSIAVIDVKPLQVQNLDINQVLNTSAGVRIREDGGLGSGFSFSLNGFSGNQVKFFIDGIPMDYFGSSMSLNNIPVNLISKIEVYKGVVPVHLGSDALGGAVNITTNKNIRNYLNVSYSFGSFNTHRASVAGRFTTEKGFVVNAGGFLNYSDNNYTVTAEVVDTGTRKATLQDVERFHDAYRSQGVQFEAGVIDKKFADELLIGFIASGNYKEIQNGFLLTNVVGEAYTTDKVIIPTLKYRKNDLFTEGLSLRFNATSKLGESMRVDTSSKIYNWYGQHYYRGLGSTAGEISWNKSLFRFNDKAFLGSAHINYDITENQSIAVNNNYSWYMRVGKDPLSYDAVPFSQPNYLIKNITGAAYSLNLFENKLRTVVFGKVLYMNSLTRDDDDLDDGQSLKTLSNEQTMTGYGLALTYFITPYLQLKTSYENTYRLPEVEEMFGNGLQLLAAPGLKPEKSQNINFGILMQKSLQKHHFMAEAAYLYRLPTNLIRNQPLGNTSKYENLQSAKASIVEGTIKYNYNRFLNAEINGTYQYIVNNQEFEASGRENYLYGAQLPNTPYLFGNATLGCTFHKVGSETGSLNLSWSTLFVESFWLKWPVNGDRERGDKKGIPRQISHDFRLSYSLLDGRYNISLACTNVLNSKLYDNFALQKPGRGFSVKLSYYIN